MTNVGIENAVKSRIESLTHTRQLIVVLGTILTGLYIIAGKDLAGKIISGQNIGTWCSPPWNTLILLIVSSLVLIDISFILSIFLLTDSIHNYSKVLEYSCKDLFEQTGGETEAALSHNRALVSDDLSYFFVRVGTLLLIFNLLMAFGAMVFSKIDDANGIWVIALSLAGLVVSTLLVVYSYHVSHYKKKSESKSKEKQYKKQFLKHFAKFWKFWRWKKAWRGSGEIHNSQALKESNSDDTSETGGNNIDF